MGSIRMSQILQKGTWAPVLSRTTVVTKTEPWPGMRVAYPTLLVALLNKDSKHQAQRL